MKTKEELREKYKVIRNNINNYEEKSLAITKKIINSDFYKSSKVIGVYSSINKEVDTSFLIKEILKDKKIVLLPKTIENNNLEFYRILEYNDKYVKESKPFNIKEPIVENCKKYNKESIDLLIIPGLCFDYNKARVGYGKGYYDKYLENQTIRKIGICFEEQLLKDDYIKTNETDIKMDNIITELNVY